MISKRGVPLCTLDNGKLANLMPFPLPARVTKLYGTTDDAFIVTAAGKLYHYMSGATLNTAYPYNHYIKVTTVDTIPGVAHLDILHTTKDVKDIAVDDYYRNAMLLLYKDGAVGLYQAEPDIDDNCEEFTTDIPYTEFNRKEGPITSIKYDNGWVELFIGKKKVEEVKIAPDGEEQY